MKIKDIQKQKAEWKRKGWSIPELRGGKQDWFILVVELVRLIERTPIADLSLSPTLSFSSVVYPWRAYAPFLKGLGLVVNKSGVLSLTDIGLEFYNEPSQKYLATLLHDRYRLFGETLELFEVSSKTVEEVDKELCREYCLDWANLSNTRRRMDWLEVLGLIQSVGNRKWGLTQDGKVLLQEWPLITPEVINMTIMENDDIKILPPPAEIGELLTVLKENPSLHKKRNTYNIWVPSPNRIENLRMIVQFSLERVSRADLFKFTEEEFNLKTSSVESMMPFLKADGLLEEVGRNIYVATPAAKAWCESGNDLDFIRILHSHKRFVGEMIVAAENVITRNEIYTEAKKYGINTEKARWIMGFLLEAGLLEETQYLHVKATPLGMALSTELPLMEPEFEEQSKIDNSDDTNDNINEDNDITTPESNALFEALYVAAKNPMAEGKASGVAFEENIAGVFRYMGFDAKRIGGAGNTDVVVRWKDDEGKTITAIVDGKSKSSGTVTHSDISDVAIETHKEKNNADYVAIVGPGFSGDTIKNHARKKGFALVTDRALTDIAMKSQALGLSLTEIALLFKVPNGLSQLNELIITRKRELDIITLVIATFKQEQDAMDSLSARDLYFILRGTSVSPSLEELINTFELLSKEEIGVLTQIKKASSTENTTYSIHKEVQSVNRLRALATAIEKGI
jgi:type III secretion system FlhB-like substrate exporter